MWVHRAQGLIPVRPPTAEEDHWLLFKSKDLYAGPPRDSVLGIDLSAATERDLPPRVRLAEPAGSAPLDDPGWVHEMGFVGRRLLAEKHGDAVRRQQVMAKI